MATTRGKIKNPETRVLVLMPTGRDASLVCSTLDTAGIFAEDVIDEKDLEDKIAAGAGALLIADEALREETLKRVIEISDRQPVWSDLPVVVFAASGQQADRLLEMIGTHFNATIVERPIRIALLVSAVKSALRARERQYQTRDLLNQLEESDRQKDLFLATLSHELRTPLNSMLGWIQLLRASSRDGGSGGIDYDHGLEVIERNARTQSELISDILFVSRVITGKLKLNFETLDVVPAIQAAIDVMLPSIETKAIRMQTHFDAGAAQIQGDPDRLQQIFWNLLSNAVKFTPAGGEIKIHVRQIDSNVEIQISDSGQGIDAEFLPYIFERFRQADNSYTRKVGGLGLGLAIVRYLVELHGGRVVAESGGAGRGATFTVRLPACAGERAEEPEPFFETGADRKESLKESLNGSVAGKIRALLVEDDADSREMLRLFLEQNNIEAIAVDSAAKAFDILAEYAPDILISDVGLPGEDGYQLMQKIRRLPPEKGGHIPAIALTGYVSQQDRTRALSVGYQEHLPKPLDMDILLNLVESFTLKKNAA